MEESTGHPGSAQPGDEAIVATIIEVMRAASVISAALGPVVREFGLSLAAFNILHTLAHAADPMPPRDISRQQVIRPQTLSDILGTLEDDGLVDRVREPGDRRMLLVAITSTGRERYQACCDPLLAVESRLLERLAPDDLTTVRVLLGQLT